ncbi:MAG: N-6 DNA methylase [Bacteroidota bacterium]
MFTHKPLEKALESWCLHRSRTTAFDDVLKMILASLAPRILQEGRSVSIYEDQYMEVVNRYPAEHVRKYAPAVLGELMNAFKLGVTASGGWCDPLGRWMEENVGSSRDKQAMGQFFTPESLCDLMAQMTVDSREPVELSVCDPSCGTARNLMAFDRACHPASFNWYVGVDIDWTVVAISAINFYFHSMRGVLIHGNSLSLKEYAGFRVFSPATAWGIQQLSAEECKRYLYTEKNNPTSTIDGYIPTEKLVLGDQLSLF